MHPAFFSQSSSAIDRSQDGNGKPSQTFCKYLPEVIPIYPSSSQGTLQPLVRLLLIDPY